MKGGREAACSVEASIPSVVLPLTAGGGRRASPEWIRGVEASKARAISDLDDVPVFVALRAVFADADVGFAVYHMDGRIAHANRALAGMTGFAVDELVGMTVHDLSPVDIPEQHGVVSPVRAGSLPSAWIERPLRRADGTMRWVVVSVSRLGDSSGRYNAVVAYGVSAYRAATSG